MLDEGLELLTRLWTGQPVAYQGRFYCCRGDFGPGRPELNPTPFLPPARQTPRIPIWVAGTWPKKPPFRRAARWDGVVPLAQDQAALRSLTPGEVREMLAYSQRWRADDTPFDVLIGGHTHGTRPAADRAVVQGYLEAGATWWLEDVSPWSFGWTWRGPWPFAAMHARLRAGPPRV